MSNETLQNTIEDPILGECGAEPGKTNTIVKDIPYVTAEGIYWIKHEFGKDLKQLVLEAFVEAAGCSRCIYNPSCKKVIRKLYDRNVTSTGSSFGQPDKLKPITAKVTPNPLRES